MSMLCSRVCQISLSCYPNTSKVENITLSLLPPLTTRQNWYDTHSDRLYVLHAIIKLTLHVLIQKNGKSMHFSTFSEYLHLFWKFCLRWVLTCCPMLFFTMKWTKFKLNTHKHLSWNFKCTLLIQNSKSNECALSLKLVLISPVLFISNCKVL